MWPFDIFAKRRERLEKQRQAEREAARRRMRDSLEAAFRRSSMSNTSSIVTHTPADAKRPGVVSGSVPHPSSSVPTSVYDDPLSHLNPLSPFSLINQAASNSYSTPADEPRHSAPSHCGSSSSHSHDYGSSSHSHSSHDHGCSSSSYDSGSSDSGSSFSSGD